MLLSLSVALRMKLKPLCLYNLHNALYLSLLAHQKAPSMRSITYLERKAVLLRNCSTKDVLPWSSRAGWSIPAGHAPGRGWGCRASPDCRGCGAAPAHTEEAPSRADPPLPACLSTSIPQRGRMKLQHPFLIPK